MSSCTNIIDKVKKRKKKKRWRDRHQVYMNQLPYDTTEETLTKWIRASLSDVGKFNVSLVSNPRNKKFSGQAFVDFDTEEDLERALTLHKKPFVFEDEIEEEDEEEAEEEEEKNESEEKKKKKKKNSKRDKRIRHPVNVTRAELNHKGKKKQKKSAGSNETNASDAKPPVRPKDDVAWDVLYVLDLPEKKRGGGLVAADVDERIVNLLRTCSETVSRNALREFDSLGSKGGANKLRFVSNHKP